MTTAPANDIPGPGPDVPLVKMITTALGQARMPLNNEKQTQRFLSQLLENLGIFHTREFRLSDEDIVDFWVQSPLGTGVVLEVKMNKARPPDILRQLERYAAHDVVSSLVLISNKAMQLTPCIGEGFKSKPLYFISLGRAWL